jgi:uncharacterized membrane protein YfcA
VTVARFGLGLLVGLVSGVLSGLFGVGGAVVTTPAVNVLLGGTAIQAVATPLPVVFPSSIVGAWSYSRAGEVSFRALRYAALPGIGGAVLGAYLTEVVNPHLLLLVTAVLIGGTAVRVARGSEPSTPWVRGRTPGWKYAAVGLGAGFVSGLLGVGGGIVMVPAFTLWIGMPLKRALGTSLVTIAVIAIPGTVVHWALGHIDWAIFASLAIGVVPGARIGSRIALGAGERALRIAVGAFLLAIAVLYGVRELVGLLAGRA